jgi:hypothetical protein
MPEGSFSLNLLPSAAVNSSTRGLKLRVPAMDMATTRSGEVTKEWVAGLASLRPVKLRLYDEMMELAVPENVSGDPMQPAFREHTLLYIFSIPLKLKSADELYTQQRRKGKGKGWELYLSCKKVSNRL